MYLNADKKNLAAGVVSTVIQPTYISTMYTDCFYTFDYLNGKFYILDNSSNWYIVNGQTLTQVCSDGNEQRKVTRILYNYNGIIYYIEYNTDSYGDNNYFIKAFNGTNTWTLCEAMYADTNVFALNNNLYMFGKSVSTGYYNVYTLNKTIVLQTYNSNASLLYYGEMILIRTKGSDKASNIYYIFNGNNMTRTNMFDNKSNVIFSPYTLNGKTIGIENYRDSKILMYDYDTDTLTTILSSSALDYPDTGMEIYKYNKRIYYYITYNEDIFIADNMLVNGNGNIGYFRISKFTAPKNVYSPNTLIIDKSNLYSGGKYSTEIAGPKIENNQRFLTGFDDVFYFAYSAFDWNAPMYYGNGSQWIKFKN